MRVCSTGKMWKTMVTVLQLQHLTSMAVTGVFGGDAIKRQVAEAIQIQNAQDPKLLNRQDEWRQVNLPHFE